MQEQLNKFLNQIHLKENYFTVFDKASIFKAHLNKQTKQFEIGIKLDYLIDPNIYNELIKGKSSAFNYTVDFVLANQPSIELVKAYFGFILDYIYKEASLHDLLLKTPINLVDNTIVFDCENNTIYSALENLKSKIDYFFKKVGITYPTTLNNISKPIEEVIIEDTPVVETNFEVPTERKFEKNTSFFKKEYTEVKIKDLSEDSIRVEILGKVFDVEEKEIKRNNTVRYNIYLTDTTDSISMNVRENKNFSNEFLKSIKKGEYLRVRGDMRYDEYSRKYVFEPLQMEKVDIDDKRYDNHPGEKRVELHLHTKMSNMDGVTAIEDYIDQAIRWGHKAIALTDHGVVQSFPEAQRFAKGKDIKVIYGMEGYVVKNRWTPVYKGKHELLKDATYVVFDLETTGLSTQFDKITEVALAKYQNGVVIDTYDKLVNPLMKLPEFIVNKTHITDEMLMAQPTITQLIPEILQFIGDSVLVAHNATFDVGFLDEALLQNEYAKLKNTIIDTLDVAHILYPEKGYYSLGQLSKMMGIPYDDEHAHRGNYDTDVLCKVWAHMMDDLHNKDVNYIDEISNMEQVEPYKKAHQHHMTFLCKNLTGVKNLFKMVSMSHCDYVTPSTPLIPKDRIAEFREGLLVGSACFNGEIYDIASTKSYNELKEAMEFYDYIEIQPLENYQWLVDNDDNLTIDRVKDILRMIVKAAKEIGKIVVATGDCHYLNPEDKIFRDVYVNAKQVGSIPHPLNNRGKCKESPIQHFRTTQEMFDGISFLDDFALQQELVVTNPNKIADMCEKINPIKEGTYAPHFEGIDMDKEITDMCNKRARELYGDPLPPLIEERMNKELYHIINNGYGVIYYLAYKLVSKSNGDGYLVGSRGSVGSSFVASLCKITEVNPLPPHYLCPVCHHAEFFTDGSVRSGFDLEDKICPECGHMMKGNGQNIPFETFLGINGDKVPDIDLNFSRDYQATAHNYTKVLCGEKNVYRAGTIGTVADKTAYGHAINYFETIGVSNPRPEELHRLAIGCTDVKRTTGQHPAGIVVVPSDMEINDFCPVQYPANDTSSEWKTTHFKFESLHDSILKLDILGHLDPMMLKVLRDMTGINPEDIPLNDTRVLSLFTGLDEIKCDESKVLNKIATSGIPEFGTQFVKGVVLETKPKKFSDLVQISGLTHGTNVFEGNAQELIKSGEHTLTDVIGCRDDIMSDLINYGMEAIDAFNIMEFVRKGKPSKEVEKWKPLVEKMRACNVPEWYIDSCSKIKYMFPKAHAVAYVIMGLRVGWFKVHYPLHYYCAFFSVRCEQFDIATMIQGYNAIKNRVEELKNTINEAKNSRKSISATQEELLDTLELALEMTARGYKFANISIKKSQATMFTLDEENNAIIPPFNTVPGLGANAAEALVKARNEEMFKSKKDFKARSHISTTCYDYLDKLGCLEELADESQMSFDLFG